MMAHWTHEEIAALVDGNITDERTAERLRNSIATDYAARSYAVLVMRSNLLLRRAFPARADGPVPARIEAAVTAQPGKVRFLRPRTRQFATGLRSLAAVFVLCIGVGAGHLLLPKAGERLASVGPADEGGALYAALETLPTGTPSDEGIMPLLSFFDGEGRVCREFEIAGGQEDRLEYGVACRESVDRWRVEIVVAAPAPPAGSNVYMPASGSAAAALDPYLEALDAGVPIDAQTERAFIENRWADPLAAGNRKT